MAVSRGLGFVLLFIAFVFLLLSTISAPIIKSFPLGKFQDIVFGVFGACQDSNCPSVAYPYEFPSEASDGNWLLVSYTRNQLLKSLILCPIALGLSFFTLVSIAISFAVEGFLILAIILSLLTALSLIVVAVMTVIIFHPYEGWLAWCLVGSAAVSIVAFALLIISFVLNRNDSSDEDSEEAASLTNFDNVNQNFNEKFSDSGAPVIGLPHTRTAMDTSTTDSYDFKVDPNSSFTNTLSIPGNKAPLNTNLYNSQPTKPNDFTNKPVRPGYTSSSKSSFFSPQDDKVSLVNSVGTPIKSNKQVAPTLVANVATRSSAEDSSFQRQKAPYPTNSVSYDQSVFQHHPEVEGHKPFTEMDDFDVDNDEEIATRLNNSDSDSDFTSVSQREYNSNVQYPHVQHYTPQNQQFSQFPQQYNGPPQNAPQQFNRGPGAQFQQQRPQQQYRPSTSDTILNNNPDFNLVGATKRRNNSGFTPVASRYKNQVGPNTPRIVVPR